MPPEVASVQAAMALGTLPEQCNPFCPDLLNSKRPPAAHMPAAARKEGACALLLSEAVLQPSSVAAFPSDSTCLAL